VKPPPFDYVRPSSLAEATAALAGAGEDAKVLAGGQSLVPMLNFRLARPTVLVDVTRVPELTGIREDGEELVLGAAVRQHAAAQSPSVRSACPLVASAIEQIGHVQIRARGTVGGSIAHADPAAELGAAAIALDARMQVASVRGAREVAARDFFVGPYMTALEPDEILVEVRFPRTGATRTAFAEIAHRSGDFALAGVAVALELDDRTVRRGRVAGFGVGPMPIAIEEVEELLAGRELTPELHREAGELAARSVEPFEGPHASPDHRRRLFGVLVRQALEEVS
jgi:CO/xanthine dehydrogenase FAD-binding subunit